MNNKVQNILRNIGFLLSVPIIIGAFVFAIAEDKRSNVKDIVVEISNPEFGFVTQKDIRESLLNENIILDQSIIQQLDISNLEEKINSNPWVEHAEIFVTSEQKVKVKLRQVNPKLRVQRTDSTTNGYYLDEKGFMIPLSRSYSADLPILTSERRIATIEQRKDLVKLAQFIEKDTFWRATISQINLDRNNDIELSSLIGDANIRFGSIENMDDKFFRLFQFYKKGINRINWDNVKELDVRFDRQLVCRRFHKEEQIEQMRTPQLYVKAKTEQAKDVQADIDIPQKITSPVIASAIKKTKEPKNIPVKKAKEEVLINRTKKEGQVVKNAKPVVEKKVSPIEKKQQTLEPKPIEEKTEVKAETKPEKPKPKKKKREIIINTEPVTLKNATQK